MREAIGRFKMFTTINKIKNADASKYISSLEPFQGSNFRAEWVIRDTKSIYEIYSYSTLIAYVLPADSVAWTSPEYHSSTTSRHMGLVRRGLDAMGQGTW
jgi:hypothetical protein